MIPSPRGIASSLSNMTEGLYDDPIFDVRYLVRLYLEYQQRLVEPQQVARDTLHHAPPTPSFAATIFLFIAQKYVLMK